MLFVYRLDFSQEKDDEGIFLFIRKKKVETFFLILSFATSKVEGGVTRTKTNKALELFLFSGRQKETVVEQGREEENRGDDKKKLLSFFPLCSSSLLLSTRFPKSPHLDARLADRNELEKSTIPRRIKEKKKARAPRGG